MPSPFAGVRGHTIYVPPLTDNARVLDVGANRGAFSLSLRSLLQGGDYFLVEPNPELVRELRGIDGFRIAPCAAASVEAVIQFHIARNDHGSSILELPKESIYDCVLAQTIEVPARQLESILEETGWPIIDLLKLDIEGAEVQLLQSLQEMWFRRIAQITVEFHSHPVFGFPVGDTVERVITRLGDLGFLAIDFSRPDRRDMLFLNRRWVSISASKWLQWKVRYEYASEVRRRLRRRGRYCRQLLMTRSRRDRRA